MISNPFVSELYILNAESRRGKRKGTQSFLIYFFNDFRADGKDIRQQILETFPVEN